MGVEETTDSIVAENKRALKTSGHMGSGQRGRESRSDMTTRVPPTPLLTAQLLVTLMIQYERLQGVQSSGVLIIFWLLCVVCAIIPFRSKILAAVAEVKEKRAICQI